jgi:hypothetical protein
MGRKYSAIARIATLIVSDHQDSKQMILGAVIPSLKLFRESVAQRLQSAVPF